jgi:5'-3' exonuclease
MGIKNIIPFLKKQCPQAFIKIHLESLRNKTIAIDTNFFLYKYLYVSDNYLSMFITLVTTLWNHQITPIFVFDGKNKLNKSEEMKKRRDKYLANEVEVQNLEKAILEYLENKTVDPILEKHSNLISKKAPKTFLVSKKKDINIEDLQYKLETMKKSLMKVTADTLNDLKELFTLIQVPWIVAHNEGEFMCYVLKEKGIVNAVISGDTDLLALGIDSMINNINTSTFECDVIDRFTIGMRLFLKKHEFLDFCILIGTDFNSNIPGIGPVNAFKMIKKHKSIEEIEKKFENVDFSTLTYVQTREIFLNQSENERLLESFKLKKLCDFDKSNISEFLFKKNLDQGYLRVLENSFGKCS